MEEERAWRTRRMVMWTNGLMIVAMALILLGIYWTTYRRNPVAMSESPDGQFRLILESEGDIKWTDEAFGRLVLKKGNKKVAVHKFQLQTQGAKPLSEENWDVNWFGFGARVKLFAANEQVLEVCLNEDGNINVRDGSNYSETLPEAPQVPEESQATAAPTVDPAISLEEQRQADGFRAIYDQVFQPQGWSMIQDWTAKGNGYILLFEDPERVEYLMYDRPSANDACGLYVHYCSHKNEDGSWSTTDGEIQEMYAYVYETGEVIAAGKTAWSDPGTEEYQQATGE